MTLEGMDTVVVGTGEYASRNMAAPPDVEDIVEKGGGYFVGESNCIGDCQLSAFSNDKKT